MLRDVLIYMVGGMYAVIFFGALIFLPWMTIIKRKKMEKMKENVKAKITAKLKLSAKEVTYIGRGFNLSPKNSRDAIFNLFVETSDPDGYTRLKDLVSELEKEEPFDDLPDEVKPSLSRIAKLIEGSGDPSDQHVLLPVTSTLNKYVDLKLEQEKVKKQTRVAYILTVISFVVGVMSFYFTLKSPGEADIKKTIEQVLVEHDKSLTQQK